MMDNDGDGTRDEQLAAELYSSFERIKMADFEAEPNVSPPIGVVETDPSFTDGEETGIVTSIIEQKEYEKLNDEQERLHLKQIEVKGQKEVQFEQKQDKMKIKRIESDRLIKWREEQKILLEKKDAEEEEKKEKLRQIAKKDLEDWYKLNNEQNEKTKTINRKAREQFISGSDEIEPGTEWERISKLCDFDTKLNCSRKNVARMRSVILKLNQTKLKKPITKPNE